MSLDWDVNRVNFYPRQWTRYEELTVSERRALVFVGGTGYGQRPA